MISDVLSEAIDEIERYQRDFPDTYRECRIEINATLQAMRRLRDFLDTPPSAATTDPDDEDATARKIAEHDWSLHERGIGH